MKQKWNHRTSIIPIIFIICLSCNSSDRKHESQSDHKSWAIAPFVKVDSINPVLTPGDNRFFCPISMQEISWEEKDVFNPAAVVRDNKIYLLYRAEDKIGKYEGTSRLGLAESTDGLHFTRRSEPVFYPDNDSLKVYEWEGGVEDPRLVESEDGTYVMTYTSYDGTTARLMLATSADLMTWKKHGIVLKGKHKNLWSKSGAIVAKQNGEKIVAAKVNGKYWMYFGDTDLFIASSEDLINWTPLEENDSLKKVLSPRKGYFDSRLVESGPYALIRDQGILLIYNGMNLSGEGRDTTLAPGAYCGGQALFHLNDPTKLVARLEDHFIQPEKQYETEGQVNQVCFLEGMVFFHGRWFLYYGTADSKIAVAVSEIK